MEAQFRTSETALLRRESRRSEVLKAKRGAASNRVEKKAPKQFGPNKVSWPFLKVTRGLSLCELFGIEVCALFGIRPNSFNASRLRRPSSRSPSEEIRSKLAVIPNLGG